MIGFIVNIHKKGVCAAGLGSVAIFKNGKFGVFYAIFDP